MELSTLRRVDWITLNFVISVWVLIGGVVGIVVLNSAEFVPYFGGFAPFGGHIVGSALSLVGVEGVLWVFTYRNADKEARWAAGLMGGFLAIKTAIVPLYSMLLVPFIGYVSLSHLLFAAKGRR